MTTTVLGVRRLNRILLERQLLTRRHTLAAEDAIAHLVGMQAQAPHPPYTGLWTRLVDFDPDELSTLLTDRSVVRLSLMRGTVHLVTADDALALRPVVQRIHDATMRNHHEYGPGVRAVALDIDELIAQASELLEKEALTAKALGLALAAGRPDVAPGVLAHVVRTRLALLQVPPRALWRRSGQTVYRTAEHWLGRPLATVTAPDATLLRYLAAFGPASVADMQAWSGLNRLREVVDRLRPRLVVYRDDSGRELFDLPDAPMPDEDGPAPVRFVPEFDNLLLAHARRERIISDEDRRRTFTSNGIIRATFLVDGFVAGMWRIARSGGSGDTGGSDRRGPESTLDIEPFRPLDAADREALVAEGERLAAFHGLDAGRVRFV